MKTIVLCRILIVLLCPIGNFYSNAQALTTTQIDELVNKTLKAFDVPGIAVAIVKDGKIIQAKGYGIRSLQTGVRLN